MRKYMYLILIMIGLLSYKTSNIVNYLHKDKNEISSSIQDIDDNIFYIDAPANIRHLPYPDEKNKNN
jgi:hypothetical protein